MERILTVMPSPDPSGGCEHPRREQDRPDRLGDRKSRTDPEARGPREPLEELTVREPDRRESEPWFAGQNARGAVEPGRQGDQQKKPAATGR